MAEETKEEAEAYHGKYKDLCDEYGRIQKQLWLATGTPEFTTLEAKLGELRSAIEAHVAPTQTPERQAKSQVIGVPLAQVLKQGE